MIYPPEQVVLFDSKCLFQLISIYDFLLEQFQSAFSYNKGIYIFFQSSDLVAYVEWTDAITRMIVFILINQNCVIHRRCLNDKLLCTAIKHRIIVFYKHPSAFSCRKSYCFGPCDKTIC